MRKKVLLVAMLDSIHTARWLGQFRNSNVQFLLFPSSPHRRLVGDLEDLLDSKFEASYTLVPGSRWFALPLWFLDKLFGNFFRGLLLSKVISRFNPDFIHALELQNAGYLLLRAARKAGPSRSKIIVTNWGSDIYWFGRFRKHRKRISELLRVADYYSAECKRDIDLALKFGFKGEILPVLPNAGGFSPSLLEEPMSLVSNRRVIAVKGYHGWAGRAKIALDALGAIREELEGLSVVVYSANYSVAKQARKLSRETKLQVTIHRKGKLTHEEMMKLFEEAKIYVGVSRSDGISTSLLEAMAMGAIPVQTSTSCCEEWFQDTGVVVHEISRKSIADAILTGLDLAKTQSNSDRNRQTIREKASADKTFVAAKTFYGLD